LLIRHSKYSARIVRNLDVFWLISFCRIIFLKNGLDTLYRLEYLYAAIPLSNYAQLFSTRCENTTLSVK